jgi:hypothetical protein
LLRHQEMLKQKARDAVLRQGEREKETDAKEALQTIPNSRTKYISGMCTNCSTPFSVTLVRGEVDTRCPDCFRLMSTGEFIETNALNPSGSAADRSKEAKTTTKPSWKFW